MAIRREDNMKTILLYIRHMHERKRFVCMLCLAHASFVQNLMVVSVRMGIIRSEFGCFCLAHACAKKVFTCSTTLKFVWDLEYKVLCNNVIFKLNAYIIIIAFSSSPNYQWGEEEVRGAPS